MGILEEVTNMKDHGMPEEEIINNLREKGISPREIRDAISQLKIKNAISDYELEEKDVFANQEDASLPAEQESLPPQPMQNYDYSQQQGYPPQGYAPQEGYETYSSAGIDANTVLEISEQVFSEKIKSFQKEVDSFNEFKSLNQMRIENVNERLKRIETVFDKLQMTILEKIGSYGQNLEFIKKEMNMMQDSFSKIAEPLVEKAEQKQEKKKRKIASAKKKSK